MKVMTASAGKTGPETVAPVSSAGQPEGKSTARTGALAALQPLERRQRQAFQRRLEAGAQHRVHDEIGVQHILVAIEFLRAGDDVNRAVHGAGELVPRHGCVARDLLGRAEQERGYVEAGFGEQPRRHHAVAAVVAAAAEHGDAPRPRELLARKGRHGRGGRAHQFNRRNPKPLRGGAVAGLHLGCGQNVHRIHSTTEIGIAGRDYFSNRACKVVRALARERTQTPFLSQRK